MKKELATREDIEFLVHEFYQIVFKDELIGYIFTEVVEVDWGAHFPVMYDFWESVLFGTGSYRGNPMLKHIDLNRIEALPEAYFDRWIEQWENAVTTHFQGVKAEEAIAKAKSMKALMLYKIAQSNNPNFIQ